MARVLTFMCTAGSTEALERLGESHREPGRRSHVDLLRAAVETAGGREVRADGERVLAVFDAPSDAVDCAVTIQRRLARHNALARDRRDVRIGLQLGETLDGEERSGQRAGPGGPAAEAELLCEAALGGQILASPLVHALASPRCACCFVPVGLRELRGLPEPLAVFEVSYEQAACEPLPLPPELAATPDRQSAFVGRSSARERLSHAWQLAQAGERQLAFVVGEPGIGKTRLAAELALDAYSQGAVVLWGRCFEDALVPYQPFVQALRHYVATCDPDGPGGPFSRLAAPLALLLPELGNHGASGADAVPELEPESERFRLFAAVTALLAEIADDAPLVLVLDDLQWADQGTLLLLRNLAFDARPASILVLGTYRDSEVPRSHPLAQLYADVLRDRPVEVVELGGLSADEAASLVESLLGWSLPPGVAQALCDETECNPFFLEEVVRHLEELGIVSDPQRLHRARLTIGALGVPRRIKELVARRVRRLPPPAVEALQVAAVVGSEFPLDVLAAVLGRDEPDVVPLLDEAVDARLLAELPARIGEYGFTHALIQQALYDEQTANRRATLHRRIGETLESLRPAAPAALAHHFARAGERSLGKVLRYGSAAGEQSLALLAYEDAAREFSRALDALERVEPGGLEQRAELLVRLGAARSRAGEAAAAEAAFAEAAELAARVGAATILARAALGYGGGTGFGGVWTKFARVDVPLVGFLEQALAAVGDDEPRLRAQLLGRLAQSLYWGPEGARALVLSEQALELARTLADPLALARALDSRHVALWQPDTLDELRPVAAEMLRVGEELGDREIQLQAYAWLITDGLESGPIEEVDRFVDAHARLAHELGQPYHLWYAAVVSAMRAHLDGRFDEMAEAIERAWRHGETAHHETALAVRGIQQLHLRLDTHGADDVVDELEQAAAASPLPAAKAVLARAYAGTGRRDEALALVASFAPDEFASVRRDCVWSPTLCYLSDVVSCFDATEFAAPLYRLLLPYADRNCVSGGAILCPGPISRFLGMLARVGGEHERALQHLRHALVRSDALGSRPLRARTQVEKAKVLLARGAEGDRERAHELLAEATAAATTLGMAQLLRDAAAAGHDAVVVA